MSFMERSAQHFLAIKAAKEIKKEIEKAGLDNLKTLANAGISIVGTYLNGCSTEGKAKKRGELSALVQMGITPDMVLSELTRQMPELAPIIDGKEGYKRGEIEKLTMFLREGQEAKK